MISRLFPGATCLLLAPIMALAGCTSSAPSAANRSSTPAQPRVATYRCGEGSEIRIENLGGSVRVHEPAAGASAGDDDSDRPAPIDLAAAPPGQQSRYGVNGYALVLEGREALWMKAGKAPLTCLR